MTDARNRKLIAKRFNEHVKLLATLFNALSIATFGAAFVVPLRQGKPASSRMATGFCFLWL